MNKIPLKTITDLWLELTRKPTNLWFNFEKEQLYLSNGKQDIESTALVGSYTNSILLSQLHEDIRQVIIEESY